MKFVNKCLGAGAALAFVSVPAFAAGSEQVADQMPLQHQVQQDFDQSAQQVTQDQAQQDAVQHADQAQQMTQDQAQQVQQSQGLIVRVTQDEQGVVQQEEVRVVTQEVDPLLLTQEDVEALFASAVDVTGISLHDDVSEMVPEDRRRGYGYRPYRRPYFYGPFGPVVYRNPFFFPNPRYGYWYYPRRWR